MNKTYRINFGTGAGDISEIETLEEAQKMADEKACYTQMPIKIYDSDENLVAMRQWYGCAPDADECPEDGIYFGDYGFYDDWYEV